MTSATVDRRFGLVGNTAIKAPVDCATTGNITLSGEQTIDGVVTSSSRVLVKNQTTTTENGIYDTGTGAWTRSIDANGNYDLTRGSIVLVLGGAQAGQFYECTATNPITIGSSAITWTLSLTASMALMSFTQAGTGAVARGAQDKMREVVSVKDFGAVGNGVADDSSAIAAALQCGAKRIYAQSGTYAIASPMSITLTNDVEFFGEGVLLFTGASSILNMLSVECAGYSLRINGLKFDGNELIAGGLKIENQSAMSSDTLPTCQLLKTTFIDFKMNAASIWNQGYYIAGSFERVEIRNCDIRNITRAAGTGVPGVSGTTGGYVSHYSTTKWVRLCIHEGNTYSNITGADLLASANNVDFDGFKFFAPDPTNNDNVDATVSSYFPATCQSYNNSYRNCRGRAIKIQAIGLVHGEKIIRDADYTILGGSNEINLQYGAGTVRDCEFFYKDYAGPTSPIQGALALVSFYQGAWYDEDHGGSTVSGLRVYNNIKAATGNNINQIVNCQVGATVLGKDRLLIRVSDIVVNRGDVDWILTLSGDTGTDGLVILEDVSVTKLTYSAIGTAFTSPSLKLIARGIFNLDGVSTPGNAKKFVSDTATPGGDISFDGVLSGHSCFGFLNTFNRGADFTPAPILVDGALTGTGDGGAVSVQTVRLADDASHTFERRFFNAARGVIIVSVDYDYTTQGVFACGSDDIYQLAAHASDLFVPSTTGANLDTDGELNLWFTGGALNIKNRLGNTYSITVCFIG